MISNRPYLLRAFYQWIVDSRCEPILVIDANFPDVKIPVDYVEGDEIVFNISPTAVRDLKMLNDLIEFKASFSGVIHLINAPIGAIRAVYAEENGEGIYFDAEEEGEFASPKAQSHLRQVEFSSDEDFAASEAASLNQPRNKPFLRLVE